MTEHADQPVPLELTEVQKLRLQNAQYVCDVNTVLRWHAEAMMRQFEIWRFVMDWQFPNLREDLRADIARIACELQEQLATLEREGGRLHPEFFATGEAIKKENNWPTTVRWNTTTLTFSPAQPTQSTVVQ